MGFFRWLAPPETRLEPYQCGQRGAQRELQLEPLLLLDLVARRELQPKEQPYWASGLESRPHSQRSAADQWSQQAEALSCCQKQQWNPPTRAAPRQGIRRGSECGPQSPQV